MSPISNEYKYRILILLMNLNPKASGILANIRLTVFSKSKGTFRDVANFSITNLYYFLIQI